VVVALVETKLVLMAVQVVAVMVVTQLLGALERLDKAITGLLVFMGMVGFIMLAVVVVVLVL
jgi:hypothetical protein